MYLFEFTFGLVSINQIIIGLDISGRTSTNHKVYIYTVDFSIRGEGLGGVLRSEPLAAGGQ